ncbi:MAG: hypothetical protein HY707_00730 [Ignavibacteriae bacterium]|nr:hypothetical protein [Ignavibacteriota bacterium]
MMNVKSLIIASMVVALCPFSLLHAQFNAGISIGEEGLRGFYLAIGNYYKVPERQIVIIKDRHIPPEEAPVMLFIAARARVTPSAVIDLRLAGKSWMDITIHYGLSPEIFYVPVTVAVSGPPYGKAYGYFKNRPKKEWKKIVLTDAEVINFVNLKFVSEHYGYAPEKVIRMKEKGSSFVAIHDEVKKAKAGKAHKVKEAKGKEKKGKGGKK